MTKATAVKAHGTAGLAFSDPVDNSTVFVNKVETKEADGKPPKGVPVRHAPSPGQLDKLVEKFKK
ncbi:hypothetical protein [Ralstonia phage RP31]|uniref:Uncharacterized protein n=1 Tax=Ralstonia phage RP31 TaxID=1923890 RepID=A0A1L7N1F3_9CAUD|nr:hypothetical protein [Ralstonia phage RP31]